MALYAPFGVDVPLNFDNTHSLTNLIYNTFPVGVLAKQSEADVRNMTAQGDADVGPEYEDLAYQQLDNTEDPLPKQFNQAIYHGEEIKVEVSK